jgi:DHA1 family tetracycline resistance protein-like MFS transporter
LLFVFIAFPETLKVRNNTPVSLFTGIRNIGVAFQKQHLRTIFFVVFLLTLGFNFFTQFFSVFLISKFEYKNFSEIANVFAYIGVWIVVAQGGLQRPLAKKYLPLKIIRISAILLGITLPLLLLPSSSQVIYIFYILPFISIFQGLTQPNITAVVSSQVGVNEQGEILGINQSIQSLGMSIPPIVAGFINLVNPNLPIAAASLCTILGWLVLVLFFKNKKEKDAFIK